MSDADIGRANYADADEMAEFGLEHAEELAARDRAAALARLSTEAPCPNGS